MEIYCNVLPGTSYQVTTPKTFRENKENDAYKVGMSFTK